MEFPTEIVGEKGYITVIGNLDTQEAGESLRVAFNQLLEQGKRTVVIDLRTVQIINSFGIGKIISCYKRIKSEQGSLMVKLSPGYVKETFELLMLSPLLPIEP